MTSKELEIAIFLLEFNSGPKRVINFLKKELAKREREFQDYLEKK